MPTREQRHADRAVVAVTSRAPVVPDGEGWRTAPGGLAPIVRGALDKRGGAWVSWNSNDTAPPRRVGGMDFEILTFTLGHSDGDRFYSGYSNRTLWPLLHDMAAQPVFEPKWWPAYRHANAAFARAAVLSEPRAGRDALFWIHDYHLMLVPSELRGLGVTGPIAFYLHTPFPSPAIFARLPERSAVLDGLAGANVIGFHTDADRDRFVDTWRVFNGAEPPTAITVPASIDVGAFRSRASDEKTVASALQLRKRLGERIILLGVERLDYTKGILERLRALEILLTRRRDLRRRVAYIQIATPSREKLPEYRRLRSRVEREIGRLNGRFTAPGHDVPFRYLSRPVSDTQLSAYYSAADVALVTPLRDGMNLVAKEYVTTQAAVNGRGALVLSEFAGAAVELTEAHQCNPFDVDGMADAMEAAVELDDECRRHRIQTMAAKIAARDIDAWADTQLRAAEQAWAAAPATTDAQS